ncbi:MAG: glutathione S-transferase family protein [Gemmatimonas sp.]
MKLYMYPASTTCRPILQFVIDEGIQIETQVVDLMKGEQYGPEFTRINPNHQVPLLEDGDFRVTESATILRYLAEKSGSHAYPKDLRERARVNEMLDWFNSNFYREWGYGFIYPQVFPHMKRPDPAVQAATVAWGREKARKWFKVLNDHWIGPDKKYLCGTEITLADYFGAALVTMGEFINCRPTAYPNVCRWLDTVKGRPSYATANAIFNGYCEQMKEQTFESL